MRIERGNRYLLQSSTFAMDVKTHWEKVYKTKAQDTVSWYLPHLETSLALIERSGASLSLAYDVWHDRAVFPFFDYDGTTTRLRSKRRAFGKTRRSRHCQHLWAGKSKEVQRPGSHAL
jgi:hypothetical protein